MAILDVATLGRIGGLKLRVRAVVEGILSGLHKSPLQGQSVEFAEHKEYAPGDELRHLDWKAFGKFDRYYVKRFEHETNLRATMVIDASGSMGFGTGGLSKLDLAKTLAAALAHVLIHQQDSAGVTVLSAESPVTIPPRSAPTHLQTILEVLENSNADGGTDLVSALKMLAERLPRRSFVCIFSDLFDERAEVLRGITSLRSHKHEVAIFHLMDPAEITFPYDDPTLFTSMEDDANNEVNPRDIRDSYLQEIRSFLDKAKSACELAGCHYQLVRTDEALDEVLLRFIAHRGSRR